MPVRLSSVMKAWTLQVEDGFAPSGRADEVGELERSFAGMRTELGSVIPTELAHGVAQALICTAGGLVLAIPSMLLYAMFRSRVLALVSGLESNCGRILRRLCFALNNPPKSK